MSMGGHSDDRDEGQRPLVAEYVLGLLEASDRARVERLIETDPTWRAEYDFWVARLAGFNDGFEDAPVPPHLRARIEARVFGDETPARTGLWNSLALWRGIAGVAAAIAVVAVGFNLFQPAPDSGALASQLVAALEEEGTDVRFVALYDGRGHVRLTALSGEPAPGRDFELWAIQGGNAPISMGVIPAEQRVEVPVSAEVMAGWGAGSVLAITLEPEGGSPTGQATGPIVAKGAVTPI